MRRPVCTAPLSILAGALLFAAAADGETAPPDSTAPAPAIAPAPAPSPAPASSSPHHRPYRSFRFRGGPKEACGSFLLTEFSWLWRVGEASPGGSDERMYGSFDLGWARNVGPSYALGGTVFLGGDNERAHAGVRARARRWLARNVSLDLSPGLILAGEGNDNTDLHTPGFIAQASLMLDDRVGVVGQVFSIRRDPGPGAYGNPLSPPASVLEEDWHVGVRLGAEPGVVAMALVLGLGIATALSGPTAF